MEKMIDEVIKLFETGEFTRIQVKETIENCDGDKDAALQKLMLRSQKGKKQ